MAKEPTQKAKLTLKALDLTLTQDIKNDYYLQPDETNGPTAIVRTD